MRRGLAWAAVVAAVSAGVVAVPPGALAAPAWHVVSSPSVPRPADGSLAAVACPAATNCFAVGSSKGVNRTGSLAEHWNGLEWSTMATPDPLTATRTEFAGVACTSGSNCFAVGNWRIGDGPAKLLVERWNGTTWSIVTVAAPGGASAHRLFGITCPSASMCLAVGEYKVGTTTKPLTEKWNGSTWSVVATPSPSGSLAAVGCWSTSVCFAAGAKGPTLALIQRWNGLAWSVSTTPTVHGAVTSALVGVDCWSATRCMAVGSWTDHNDRHMLTERWTGSGWTVIGVPHPNASASPSLRGVTCPAAPTCFAIGSFVLGGSWKSLVEKWNGTSWSVVTSPEPNGAVGTAPAGIACASTTSCFMVGFAAIGSTMQTITERWNGLAWALVVSPTPVAPTNFLNGVTCPATNNCLAVGFLYSNDSLDGKAVIEKWNGTRWTVLPSASHPAPVVATELSSVVCASATKCFAVGSDHIKNTTPRLLIERWNGSVWSVVNPTSPGTLGSTSKLSGVACASAARCYAVGYYKGETLVERWTGGDWSRVASPNPSGSPFSVLNGVACPGASLCFAVGRYDAAGTTKPLVERWKGGDWERVLAVTPATADVTQLWGISCPNPEMCLAVGDYKVGGTTKTMVQKWNNVSWSVVASPNPAGASFSTLTGIACTSGSNCFAAGRYVSANVTKTLVEHWNGSTWTIVPSPNPGTAATSLSGIACPAATNCFAVGNSLHKEKRTTLIERYS